LYPSPKVSRVITARRISWVKHGACMGEMKNAYTILVGISEGKRPQET
jgi:ribonuclease I